MKARRFAVLGDPIAHSKSPAMHTAAFRALHLPHTYEALRTTAAELPLRIAQLKDGTFDGFNVTVPHKQRVLEHVDGLDASAKLCAAANTLVPHEDGKVIAYNTDVPALAEEIRRLAPDLARDDVTAIVIGTGGAARSAIVALAVELGVARVIVRARADADARAKLVADLVPQLCAAGSRTEIVTQPLEASAETERHACLVVQATSAGMQGASPGDAIARAVSWADLPARAAALDVVYAPPETPFLRYAAAHGLRAANGLGMLVRQGALAFELWLGVPAPYNAMLTTVM